MKRLTASDLTLFKWHFTNRPAGKQKAINLDSKVLVDELYPRLGEYSVVPLRRYPLDLYLFGPGMAPANNLQRKILKQTKNWRLNGEFIDNPVDDPGLYDVLRPGDFALFEFVGDTHPTSANVVLLANAVQEDAGLHKALSSRFPDGSMWALKEQELGQVLASASPQKGHPLWDWADTGLLEDAALGGAKGAEELIRRRGRRGVSPEDFARSRRAAEATGVAGEELINAWLRSEQDSGRILEYEWSSSINAVAPYDFRVNYNDGGHRLVDAKSTVGDFGAPIHLSFRELSVAVEGDAPYDIYRVFNTTEGRGSMRIARDIGPRLKSTLDVLRCLPSGVAADSISLRPELLEFEAAVIVLGEPSGSDDETLAR